MTAQTSVDNQYFLTTTKGVDMLNVKAKQDIARTLKELNDTGTCGNVLKTCRYVEPHPRLYTHEKKRSNTMNRKG